MKKAQGQGQAKCNLNISGGTKNERENNSTKKLPKKSSGRKNFNNRRPTKKDEKPDKSKPSQNPISKKRAVFDTHEILEKDPQTLLKFLEENLADFTEFLATSLPPDSIVQIVFIMGKICLLKASEKSLNVVLSQTQQIWMKQLDMFLVKLSLDEERDNASFWKNPEAFWSSLVVLFETILDTLGYNLTQFFSKVVKSSLITIGFHKTIQGVCANQVITEKLRNLNASLNKLSEAGELCDCTDNYQTVKVHPDPGEFETDKRPYVRQNVIDGSYKNVNHYLDTHFRLLREDFFGPLRKAICAYRENLRNDTEEKITEFHVYPKAKFFKNSVGEMYKLLDPGSSNYKYAHNSEDFKTGNLLCFSADSFETIFFGIVAPTDRTNKTSCTNVELFEERPFLYAQSYTMLVSTAYFGPYYLVLKALQNFNTSGFPMEKYIINVVNEQETPAYLKETTKYTIDNLNFTVLNFESWPSRQDLKLNEMQYEAFRHALTSKFAIIQGPPGTGKTHLGLKIAQTLIENGKAWGTTRSIITENRTRRIPMWRSLLQPKVLTVAAEPILVIAYTNHALDQFLEGLIPYTEEIVRMGQQSKNEAIRRFNFRRTIRLSGTEKEDICEKIRGLLRDNEVIMEELENILLYKGIFNIKRIAWTIPELCSSSLVCLSYEDIQSWLLGEFETEEARNDRWNMIKNDFKDFSRPNANLQFSFRVRDEKYHILTLAGLQKFRNEFEHQLANQNAVKLETIFQEWSVVEEDCKRIEDNALYLQWRLEHAEEHRNLYPANPINENDLQQLSYNDRWILYFHWLNCYAQHLKNNLDTNTSKLQQLKEQLNILKQQEKSASLSQAAVVGMTTSGAALHRHLLENLKFRIVIIEEAAEVLESHIVISLTSHCEHLILIGDHQQLRPSTEDYEIEKEYNLGVSLFERMVRNGVCYKTLGVQHRMRPEIARLIVPAIYPHLENHESTYDFPSIRGITHNVFFINHSHPEASHGNSKKNFHEAEYVIALARHLILQNIDPKMITILTTYKGQMYEIRERQQSNRFVPLRTVAVTVVDNFQGEENQIILLSLVRSNNYNNIGFLATENRVCVALSRAKRGFYMIGNMDLLNRSSQIWPKIKKVLESNGQIGPGLQLACQLHPLNVTTITRPEDFLQVPEGGCYEPCHAELPCGHVCQNKCHVIDREHSQYYRCKEPCTRSICSENHPCPRRCSEMCKDCIFPVVKVLPCGHVATLLCSMDVAAHKCEVLVELVLKCGHSTEKRCFEDEDRIKCAVMVEVILPKCGHNALKPCHADKDTFRCTTIVEDLIPRCGHNVQKPCFKPMDEMFCNVRINIKPECGHLTTCRCGYKNSILLNCPHKCLKKLKKCGHICQNKCHYLKDEKHATKENRCKEKCKKFKRGCKAAHKCDLLCSDPCQPCNGHVEKILPCGHSKVVTCGTFGKNHKCEQRYCYRTKPCGHTCFSKCHPVCDYACNFKVAKWFSPCGHRVVVNCSTNLALIICRKCRPVPKYLKREE